MKNGCRIKKSCIFAARYSLKVCTPAAMGGELHGEQQCPPLFFFCTFPEKTPKIHHDFLGNQRKLAGHFFYFVCNYLTHNKIKIFIFFLKIVVFIKICRIFASLTTNTNNKNKETMKKTRNIYEIKYIFRDFTRTVGNLSYKEMVRKRRIAKELGTEIEVRIVGKY